MKNLYFLLLFTIGVVANDYALEGESSIKDIKSIGKKVENNHNTKFTVVKIKIKFSDHEYSKCVFYHSYIYLYL